MLKRDLFGDQQLRTVREALKLLIKIIFGRFLRL